ncbi:MAG: spore coat protein, partial [Nocardioidaceae bacterium]
AGRLRAPQEASVLAGLDYALLRNDVLANRPIASPQHDTVEVPQVLGVFGDDSIDTAASLARVLAECDRPVEATFVHADARARADVEAVQPAFRQRFEVVEPDPRVVERVVRADVVLSDAGTSAWELLCLGAATGLVWSAEDQVEAYRGLMVQRVVIGLGSVEGLRDDPAPGVEKMTRLLGDARERTRLADAGWRLVDGMGRARVADALLALL